jgi:hypothetical protein
VFWKLSHLDDDDDDDDDDMTGTLDCATLRTIFINIYCLFCIHSSDLPMPSNVNIN